MILSATQQRFDHALNNVAMLYGLTRQQVAAARQSIWYAEQLETLEAYGGGESVFTLACHLVLQSCGHEQMDHPASKPEPKPTRHLTVVG